MVSSVNGFATSWIPSPDGQFDSIAVVNNTIFVTGTFAHIGGALRNSLASIDAASGMATAWNPSPMPPLQSLGDFYVSHSFPLIVDGDRLFAGGSFTNIAGQTRSGAASFDLATGGITGWSPYAIAGQITSLAAQGDRAYIGGFFRSVNGLPRRGLAALDAASGVANSWNPGVSGAVVALTPMGETLYLGGSFSRVGSQPRTNLAAVDLSTGQVASWSPALGGTVNALAIVASNVYLGGEFSSVDGQARTNLAAIGFDGTVSSWNPGAPGWVQSLLAVGNVIYVAGAFDQLAGQSRPGVGGVEAESGMATSFNPTIAPAWPGVYQKGVVIEGLALQGDQLFATGLILGKFLDYPYTASFELLNSALKWEMQAGQGGRGVRIGITLFKNTLYVGDVYNFLLAIDPSTGALTPWLPSGSGFQQVHVIAPAGDSLVVGGQFGTVNGVPLSNLAVFPPPRQAQLGAQTAGNGSMRIQIHNEPGAQYVLQASTNFLNWVPLTTNTGSYYYDDTNAAKVPAMFYRAQKQP